MCGFVAIISRKYEHIHEPKESQKDLPTRNCLIDCLIIKVDIFLYFLDGEVTYDSRGMYDCLYGGKS